MPLETPPQSKRELAHVQLLTAEQTARLLAISVSTLWRGVRAERLPQPMRLGPRLVRWRLADIEAFVGVRAPRAAKL